MADSPVFVPDPTNELTLEYVMRQLWRISDTVGNGTGGGGGGGGSGGNLRITALTSSDSPYTTLNRDEVILADTASGAITINLQAGTDRRELYIKNIATSGANAVTVTPDGSDDYDRTGGNITLAAANLEAVHIIYSSDEANWFSLGHADGTV